MKGKTVEEVWLDFKAKVIPRDAGEVQRVESRRAFYAGAAAMFELVCRVIPDEVSEEQGEAMLTALDNELGAFAAAIKAGKA